MYGIVETYIGPNTSIGAYPSIGDMDFTWLCTSPIIRLYVIAHLCRNLSVPPFLVGFSVPIGYNSTQYINFGFMKFFLVPVPRDLKNREMCL